MAIVPTELVSVYAFACKFRVDEETVRRWIADGNIAYELVGPRMMCKVRVSDLIAPMPSSPTPAAVAAVAASDAAMAAAQAQSQAQAQVHSIKEIEHGTEQTAVGGRTNQGRHGRGTAKGSR